MQPVLNDPQLAPTWANAERVPQNTITAKNNPLYLSSKKDHNIQINRIIEEPIAHTTW